MAICALHIDEILENILKFADGTTLANAEAVCTNWKSVVTRLNKNYDIWRLCCANEIPDVDLYDILTLMYPRFWLPGGGQLVLWKMVYKHWKQWIFMPKWTHIIQKTSFNFGPNNMNSCFCVKSSGDWLLIGTRNGLSFYNINNSFTTEMHLPGFVLHIELNEQDVPEKMKKSYLPQIIPGDMEQHFKHDCALLYMKGPTPFCMYLDLHTGRLKNEGQPRFVNRTGNQQERGGIVSISIRPAIHFRGMHEQRMFQDEICLPKLLTHSKIIAIKEVVHSQEDQYYMIDALCSKEAADSFLDKDELLYKWHGKLIITVTEECIEILVHDVTETYSLEDLSGNVTAVFFYANMLFLGTDLGKVFMYRVSKLEDLLELDLKNPTWSVRVCREPVKGFEIIESDPRPTIVCYSAQHIYMVKFLKA